MSMYECSFCGSDEGGFPKVILLINKFPKGNDTPEHYHNSLFEDKFEEIAVKYNLNQYGLGEEYHKSIKKVWKEFNNYFMEHGALWFCSNKCAQFYLTHELPEWKLDKLGE